MRNDLRNILCFETIDYARPVSYKLYRFYQDDKVDLISPMGRLDH